MSKQIFGSFILLWIFQIGFAQTLSHSSPTFTLNGIPYYTDNISKNKDQHGKYKYVWYLSDGTYDFGFITVGSGGGSLQKTYNPSGGIPLWAQIELTAIYDNDDKPKKYKLILNPTGNNPPDFQSYGSQFLYMPLLPRKNDTLTYVFKYGNLCDLDSSGQIGFTYDNSVMELLNIDLITSQTTQISNSPGSWRASYSGLAFDNFRQVFLQVKFKNPPINQSFFVLKIQPINENCDTQIDTIFFALKPAGDPHDPNFIEGNKPKICPLPIPIDMTFGVVFQNIGIGPADSVTVKLQLPDCFLFTNKDINILSPSKLPSIMGSNREITWILTKKNGLLKNGKPLRGTNETQKNFTEDETRDSVLFRVNLDPNKPLLPCSVIPIHADIYFEKLGMVATNDYFIEVQCDSCDACTGALSFLTLPDVFTGNKLNLPSGAVLAGSKILWMPALGLSDPTIADPVATPGQNQVYYASVLTGCSRSLFKVLVKGGNPGSGGGCAQCGWKCWLLLFLVLGALLWAFQRFRR